MRPQARAPRRTWIAAVVLVAAATAIGGLVWRLRAPALPDRPLRIGFIHDPPYMQKDPDGRPMGLSVAVISEAARRQHIALEWIYWPDNVIESLRTGAVDLWPALTIIPPRQEVLYFSDPWLVADVYVVVPDGQPMPGKEFTGRVGHAAVPVLEYLRTKHYPRGVDVIFRDGDDLARAFCAGSIDVAFLPMSDATRANLDPKTACAGHAMKAYSINDPLRLAVAARPELRGAVDRLRQELDRMAGDGSLTGLVMPYSYYQASQILAIFDQLEERARARQLMAGVVALAVALVVTLGLCLALYTASRSAARARAARDRLEGELRQAQKLEAIGRLAGGVAHDFNNLLTVVTGYSQLVLDDLGADDPRRPAIEEVKRAGDRASSLVGQLLAFGRRQQAEPRVLSLNREVAGAAGMLKGLLAANISLDSDLAAQPDHVKMDPGQLHQIVLNLALNARDAMPDGGALTIATSVAQKAADGTTGEARAEPRIQLRVNDTGIGMDDETLAHAFEPFFTTKPQGGGKGLGLSSVYGIVVQSGGTISVESMPGQGTSVTIELPMTAEPLGEVAALQGRETHT